MIKSEELTNPNSCMSKARPDEWTFVLLARDKAAANTIRYWVEERIRLRLNKRTDPQILEAFNAAREIDALHLGAERADQILAESLQIKC